MRGDRLDLALHRKDYPNYQQMYEKVLNLIKIKEAQVKVTVLGLYTSIWMGKIRDTDNIMFWQGCVACRTFILSWWTCKKYIN